MSKVAAKKVTTEDETEFVYTLPITVHRPELKGPQKKRKAEFILEGETGVRYATWVRGQSQNFKNWYYDTITDADNLPTKEKTIAYSRLAVETVKRSTTPETFAKLMDYEGPAIDLVFMLITTEQITPVEGSPAAEEEEETGVETPDLGK